MKKIIISILLSAIALSALSCGKIESENVDNSVDTSISETKVVKMSAKFGTPESFNEVYDFCDCLVVAHVKSIGDSYLLDGELDTSGDELSINRQLVGIRTPYEIEIINVYKGDFSIGDTITIVSAHGTLAGYTVDFGLPAPEVGKTYIMPLNSVYGTDEWSVRCTAMAEVVMDNVGSNVSTMSSAVLIEPLMFDSAYKGLDSIADIETAVSVIKSSVVS